MTKENLSNLMSLQYIRQEPDPKIRERKFGAFLAQNQIRRQEQARMKQP